MNSQSTKGFQSSENNAIIWTHVIMHLSKLIERMKQKGDCVIRVIMMCQRGLTSCNKRSILWGMLIIGEAVHVQGHGVCGKSLFLHLDFAFKLKLFFKKKKKRIKKIEQNLADLWDNNSGLHLCIIGVSEEEKGTSLVVQCLRLCAPRAGGPGLIPGQGTRSLMPQLRPDTAK